MGTGNFFKKKIFSIKIAGPLKLAEETLTKDNNDDLFFVFNSDVICEFPLQKMVDFHKAHGKEGTIMVARIIFSYLKIKAYSSRRAFKIRCRRL